MKRDAAGPRPGFLTALWNKQVGFTTLAIMFGFPLGPDFMMCPGCLLSRSTSDLFFQRVVVLTVLSTIFASSAVLVVIVSPVITCVVVKFYIPQRGV